MPDTKTGSHNVASVCDTLNLSDQFSILHKRDNKAIGYSESIWQGRVSSAEWTLSGTLNYQIQGTPPQGEEDTLSACRILVQKWNEDGSKWAEPIAGQDEVDCQSESTVDPHEYAQIQVVQAISESDFFKELAQSTSGCVRRENVGPDRIADSLKIAIRNKSEKYSKSRKAKLCLALNATRLPGLGFDDIVGYFRKHYSQWASSLGFASIWLVGPSIRLTWRLDI